MDMRTLNFSTIPIPLTLSLPVSLFLSHDSRVFLPINHEIREPSHTASPHHIRSEPLYNKLVPYFPLPTSCPTSLLPHPEPSTQPSLLHPQPLPPFLPPTTSLSPPPPTPTASSSPNSSPSSDAPLHPASVPGH